MATLLEETLQKGGESSSAFLHEPSDLLSLDDSIYVEGKDKSKTSKKKSKTTDGVLEKLMESPGRKKDKFEAFWELEDGTNSKATTNAVSDSAWDRLQNSLQVKEEKKKKRSSSSKKIKSSSDHGVKYAGASRSDRERRPGRQKSTKEKQSIDALLSPRQKSKSKLSKSEHPKHSKSIEAILSPRQKARAKLSKSEHNIDALLVKQRSSKKLSISELRFGTGEGIQEKEKKSRSSSKSSSRSKKLKSSKGSSEPALSTDRARRSGSKKTPKSSRRSTVTIDGRDSSSKRSSKSKSRSTPKSKRRSTEDMPFPSPLPFGDDDDDDGDDDGEEIRKSSRSSGRSRSRSSSIPLRKSSVARTSRALDGGFDMEINSLHQQMQQMANEKNQENAETSKQMQDLKKKALDVKLELQKSEIENREMRADLREAKDNLREAELDILDLENRLKLKTTKVRSLEDDLDIACQKIEDMEEQIGGGGGGAQKGGEKSNEDFEMKRALREKEIKIGLLETELDELLKNKEGVTEDTITMRRELRAARTEVQAMKSRYEASQERNNTLDDEVEHWKKQSLGMEDELADVKEQLKYWKAKYEDIVGASDTAKDSLANSNRYTAKDSLANSNRYELDAGKYDFESPSTPPGNQSAGIGGTGLWSQLTNARSPAQSRPRYAQASSARDFSRNNATLRQSEHLPSRRYNDQPGTDGGQLGISGLWSKLTTPTQQERPKYNRSMTPTQLRSLSNTMH